jgi:antitoxin VapB
MHKEAAMQPHRTRVFRSGNSQAVRLPKALAFPDGAEVEVVREGNAILLRSAETAFQEMLIRLEKLPKPDSIEVRDVEEIPEPKGL